MSNEEDKEYKTYFAEFLLDTPDDPFKAALKVFPENINRALRVAKEWYRDPFVLSEIKRIKTKGTDLETLPTEADLAREIWDRAKLADSDDDAVKLFKLYAEVRGFINKPKDGAKINLNVNPNVMVVKDKGDDSDWEARLRRQQRKMKGDVEDAS